MKTTTKTPTETTLADNTPTGTRPTPRRAFEAPRLERHAPLSLVTGTGDGGGNRIAPALPDAPTR